jgi:hypothetical protein
MRRFEIDNLIIRNDHGSNKKRAVIRNHEGGGGDSDPLQTVSNANKSGQYRYVFYVNFQIAILGEGRRSLINILKDIAFLKFLFW